MATTEPAPADDSGASQRSAEYLRWEGVEVCPLCASPNRSVVDSGASVVRCHGL